MARKSAAVAKKAFTRMSVAQARAPSVKAGWQFSGQFFTIAQRGLHRVHQLVGIVAHQPDARLAGVHHLLDGVPHHRQPFLMQPALGQALLGEGRDAAQHVMQETRTVAHASISLPACAGGWVHDSRASLWCSGLVRGKWARRKSIWSASTRRPCK